jgi:hypothetical protein
MSTELNEPRGRRCVVDPMKRETLLPKPDAEFQRRW